MSVKVWFSMGVIIAATACGLLLASSLKRRCKMLSELLCALSMLKIQILEAMEPLEIALVNTDFPLFEMVAKQLGLVECVDEAWKKVSERECRRGGCADCFMQPEIAAVSRLFERLGQSGRAEQKEAIRICAAFIEDALVDAQARLAQTGKLYASVGFLAGLAIVVLFV